MDFNSSIIEQEKNKKDQGIISPTHLQFNLFSDFSSPDEINTYYFDGANQTDKTEFNKLFSIFTHNIRNSFGTLLGFSDLLDMELEDINDGEKKYFASEIRKNAKSIYYSFENFVYWVALSNDKYKIDFEKIDLYEIILEAVQYYRKNVELKQIQVNVEKKPNQFVYANRNLISILIKNLISNAVKFTDCNGRITVKFEYNSDEIVTTIEDTGKGFKAEIIPYLFTAEGILKSIKSNEQEEKGIGLGLILSKQIIDVHKGRIWLKSGQNKGSTFSFSLKVVEVLPEE